VAASRKWYLQCFFAVTSGFYVTKFSSIWLVTWKCKCESILSLTMFSW